MTGASLGYSGYYDGANHLYNVGIEGGWRTSVVAADLSSYYSLMHKNDFIEPRRTGGKIYGRAVRYNKSLISS